MAVVLRCMKRFVPGKFLLDSPTVLAKVATWIFSRNEPTGAHGKL